MTIRFHVEAVRPLSLLSILLQHVSVALNFPHNKARLTVEHTFLNQVVDASTHLKFWAKNINTYLTR